MKKLRDNKGINMITLSVAVVILVIITSMLVYGASDGVKIKRLNDMYNDIENLDNKVASYFRENGEIPIKGRYDITGVVSASALNPNDGDSYYAIDLQLLPDLTLNYGRDYENIKGLSNESTVSSDCKDLYIINKTSHTIYYAGGIEVDGVTYYRSAEEYSKNIELYSIPIYTAEQMSWIGDGNKHSIAEEGGTTYTFSLSATYSLQNDIDLSSVCSETKGNWTPIGTSSPFIGTFLGNGHTIKNIYINNDKTGIVLGLWGYIGNCTIKDLTVTGNIKTSVSVDAGGIIGKSIADSKCNIINCSSEVNVSSTSSSYSIGGIIGVARGTTNIKDCNDGGNVSGGNSTGGLVGYLNGSLTIESCYNTGTITNISGTDTGGLVGGDDAKSNSITITNSYNLGVVEGKKQVGGLIGRIAGTVEIEDSYNKANITNTTEDITASSTVGGIVGNSYNNVTIKNTYNTGDITAKATSASTAIYVGGIIGYMMNGTIDNDYNTGIITGGNRTGGIVGMMGSGSTTSYSDVTISNTYNIGEVSSNLSETETAWCGMCGGILGMTYYSNLNMINCYNSGNLNSLYDSGGLVRSLWYGENKIINCYNLGNVYSSKGVVGGLAGNMSSDSDTSLTMMNVYNTGVLTGTKAYGIIDASSNSNVTISMAYYLNNVTTGVGNIATGASVTATSMSSTDMKNKLMTYLNDNVSTIKGKEITDIELSRWKQASTDSYPEFDW
jgi:hypothetical protein